MFGASKPPQNEKTNFNPMSPYGAAKLYGHWITRIYRESYGLFACSGILFNHESPLRGETFVTKKITKAVGDYFRGNKKILELGNLDAKRDWGHSKEYVQSMWKILQKKKPKDYVISTDKSYSVRIFVEEAYKNIGIKIKWIGKGKNEKGLDKKTNRTIISINKKYFRPNEVDYLKGDSSKAKRELKWKPKISFKRLVKEMVRYEIDT